jgi:ATP-binding cassette subfamily B multidrug efflux pump
VGLIGRSGAGKTTLVNLLLRLHDVETGRVLIDGQNIAEVQQETLRRHIGVVTQDTALLHRSVRENIAYGRPGRQKLMSPRGGNGAGGQLCLRSGRSWPGNTGLDAQVGERGVKLSGGQRQRIAIARVLLKNAPILLLDEATSALDTEVEAAIQDSLYELMAGKTVIAIAHRLSTIAELDRLIVMDKGQIIEDGTHASLLEAGGLYSQLWRRQSGGFLTDTRAPAADAAE